MPALDDCAHCGAAVEAAGDAFAFGLATGGVLCPACRPGQPHVATLSGRTLAAIRASSAPGTAWRRPRPRRPSASATSGRPSGRSSATRSAEGRASCPISEPERCRRPIPRRPTPRRTARRRRGLARWPRAWRRRPPGDDRPGGRSGRSPTGSPSRTAPTAMNGPTPTARPTRLALRAGSTRRPDPVQPRADGRSLGLPRPEGLGEDQVGRRPRRRGRVRRRQEALRPGRATTRPRSSARRSPRRRSRRAPPGARRPSSGSPRPSSGPEYVKANDSYELLIKKYPGTEYVDKLVAREYEIAQIWLATEDPKAKPDGAGQSRFDGRLPFVDASGYAVKALEHVRLHDPPGRSPTTPRSGPPTTIDNVGDYETAAVYYDQLIADHPKSEFQERAQLSSIDAKMKGYIGPEYDITGLEQARETIKQDHGRVPRARRRPPRSSTTPST